MTIDERIEALTMNLELGMREIEALRERQEQIAKSIEKSIEAMRDHQEQTTKNIEALQVLARQDGENIRALARIAEIHDRRLSALEGDDQ
jgi:hypothetical protein